MQSLFKSGLISIITLLVLIFPTPIAAHDVSSPTDENLEAVITNINPSENTTGDPNMQTAVIDMTITSGSIVGQSIQVDSQTSSLVHSLRFKPGDRVMVLYTKDPAGNPVYYITDHIRTNAIWLLFTLFVAIAIGIGRFKGLTSLLGMAFSFLVIFQYVLPQIASGADPTSTAIFGAALMIPVTFYLSHGLNRKTTTAILGTLIALIITGILANFFIDFGKLSGYASEEAGFLQVMTQGLISIRGLLLAGIIIGAVGILDDITVSQSAIVFELKATDKNLDFWQLYHKTMNIGRDHISSVVNTLVLVYTGAALPLLLLFINNPQPFHQVINQEIIAEEIIRTLVGSIGLILAVPITTLIAVAERIYLPPKNK